MKRPAFTLIEVLVVIPVILAAGLLITTLSPVAIRDVPHLSQTLSRQRQIQKFLARLQDDVDAAAALPANIGKETCSSHKLFLQTPDGALVYEVRDGQIIRTQRTGPKAGDTFEWDIPEAKVKFQRWTRDRKAYAVDIHTALVVTKHGQVQECFENHHVFFLHVLPRGRRGK
ncbi:MAG: hypothetical protein JXA11_06685 [Phycisphaerae bacterium]|nr:hypothetical protein [Phycisphaerae bacterium]